MKIEMGESLILSWLRHVKGCQSVQLNWKPSNNWKLSYEEEMEVLMEEIGNYFRETHSLELFPKKVGLTQLLKQGEVDALGIEFNSSKIKTLFGIDVAFHEKNLIYGSRKETNERVLKKLVRTAFFIYGYFKLKEGTIAFASPKIGAKQLHDLTKFIEELNIFMKEKQFVFNFVLYANDSFKNEILDTVILESTNVADTSELFMRSVQMLRLFGKIPKEIIQEALQHSSVSDVMKIGAFVRSTFHNLSGEKMLSKEEVKNLLDKNYSKRIFAVDFPVLKVVDSSGDQSKQRKVGKYLRYWSEEFTFRGKKYFVCSQWLEKHQEPFLKWLAEVRQKN